MNLYHLRVFLKVAEHEHITRASEELVLSQPAVTKIIQSLEHEIGMELVERQGRRIVLTYTGRVLYSYARRLFASFHCRPLPSSLSPCSPPCEHSQFS